MGLLPGLPSLNALDLAERAIAAVERLAAAVEAHNAQSSAVQRRCGDCEQVGRLRCPKHGPVKVPTLDSTR